MKKTTTQAELERWIAEGKSAKEIAEILGCSPTIVYCALRTLGIKTVGMQRFKNEPTPEAQRRISFAMEMFEERYALEKIAGLLGIHQAALFKTLKRYGMPTSELALRRLQASKSAATEQASA